MPKMKPDTKRVSISMADSAIMADAMEVAAEAAASHEQTVPTDTLTTVTWFRGATSTEALSRGVPAAKTRWTKDGNLSVEVC